MKKHFLLFTILVLSIVSCQSINQNSKNENFEKLPKFYLKTENKLAIQDSINLKNKENVFKFILMQNDEKIDYFKYIFPIITLIIGIGINRLIDYRNDIKKIKKSGKRWLSELQVLKNPISYQIENIDEFLIEHNNQEKHILPSPKLVTTLNCEVFNSLDKSELVEFLERFKKYNFHEAVEYSNEINGLVSLLKSTYINFRTIFEDYKINVSRHNEAVSRHLQSLMKEFIQYGIQLEKELEKDPINDPRYKQIYDLMELEILPYQENNDFDLYKLEKDFFKPLITILSRLRNDDRTYMMFDYARNGIIEIKAIKMEKYYLDVNFKNIKKSYLEIEEWLPKVLKLLS